MKKLLLGSVFLVVLSFPYCVANAYLPHKGNSKEFRIVATSKDFSDFTYHGQIVGGQLFHKDVKIAGLMEMNSELSAMKALAEYSLNDYVKIGLIAGLTNKGGGLGEFVLTGNIPIGDVAILPFIKVTHEVIGEGGAVIYLTIKKAVFNFGVSYRPKIGNSKNHQFSLMVGTGLK